MPIQSIDDHNEEPEQKAKRKEQRIYESLSEAEFVKLLEHTKSIKHQVAFILAYGSGLRISEVTKLTPEDINFKENKIFIRQAKGSKDRIVNIAKWFKEKHIKVLPLKISERALQAGFRRSSHRAGINSIIGSYILQGRTIPIQKYHFHSLRHSYSTRCLEKGLPIHYLQAMLGHTNIATTNRYIKANPKDAIDAIMEKGI